MSNKYSKKNDKVFRWKVFLGILIIILVVAIIFITLQVHNIARQNTTVATINGEPILYTEFMQFLSQERVGVYSYFRQKYGVDNTPEFWTASYGGEVPIKIAREKTLHKLKKIKIEQLLAKKYGLMKDIRYTTFLERLKMENKRRKDVIFKGQVLYGPQEYNKREYFHYIHSNMLIDLKERMEGNEITVTIQEVKQYYEANKEKYKMKDYIKVDKIAVTWVDEKGNVNDFQKDEAKKKAQEIKVALSKGESFEQVAKKYQKDGRLTVTYKEHVFDENTARHDFQLYSKSLKTAQSLKSGKMSEVFEEGNGFIIIKLIEKKDRGYIPFDEISTKLKSLILEGKYEKYIKKLLKNADVSINKKVFNTIRIK